MCEGVVTERKEGKGRKGEKEEERKEAVCETVRREDTCTLYMYRITGNCYKVKIPDRTSYNFTLGNGNPARELTVYFNIKMIIRGYHTYQSAWVAVGEE